MFQITIDDLKQIILIKDESIQTFLMEIQIYYCANITITGSGFGGNDKTHKETQRQANHESKEASGLGFAALHWPRSSSRRNSLR